MHEPELITAAEAAELLGLPISMLRDPCGLTPQVAYPRGDRHLELYLEDDVLKYGNSQGLCRTYELDDGESVHVVYDEPEYTYKTVLDDGTLAYVVRPRLH